MCMPPVGGRPTPAASITGRCLPRPLPPAQALNTLKVQLAELLACNEALCTKIDATRRELAGFEGEFGTTTSQSSAAEKTLRHLQAEQGNVWVASRPRTGAPLSGSAASWHVLLAARLISCPVHRQLISP
jgi:hypothetical protein